MSFQTRLTFFRLRNIKGEHWQNTHSAFSIYWRHILHSAYSTTPDLDQKCMHLMMEITSQPLFPSRGVYIFVCLFKSNICLNSNSDTVWVGVCVCVCIISYSFLLIFGGVWPWFWQIVRASFHLSPSSAVCHDQRSVDKLALPGTGLHGGWSREFFGEIFW